MKLNVTKSESRFDNMAPEVNQYIAEREEVWESIIDPVLNVPWYTPRYISGRLPKEYRPTLLHP